MAYEFDEPFVALTLRTRMYFFLIEGRQGLGLVQTSYQVYALDELFHVLLLGEIVGEDRGMLCRVRRAQRETPTAVRRGQRDDNGIALTPHGREKERSEEKLEV